MPPGRAGSLESLRRLNRLRVIRALRDEGQISRADIARRTGLSRSTVSSLVADLQADGLVVERPEPGSAFGAQGGRPPILLSFDASAGAAVGVDFGHSHLRVAVSDLASTILAERTRPLDTDHDAQEGLEMAAELVVETLADAGVARGTVIGAGMGLPGPIDQGDGTVGSSAILPGWIGMAASAELHRRLDFPVLVDNDANLGALAEAAFGAGRDAGDLIYLKVSSGIGAGLILNGRLYRGSAGLAGELGHVLVNPDGIVCRCGNRGCLETIAATGALVDVLRRSHGDDLTVAGMIEAARAGDAGCRRAIGDAGPCARPGRGHPAQRAQPRDGDRGRRPGRGGRSPARRRPRIRCACRSPRDLTRRSAGRRGARRARTGPRRARARGLRGRPGTPRSSRTRRLGPDQRARFGNERTKGSRWAQLACSVRSDGKDVPSRRPGACRRGAG